MAEEEIMPLADEEATLRFSAEQIDQLLDVVNQRGLQAGSVEIIVDSKNQSSMVSATIGNFTANTHLIVSLRVASPTPMNCSVNVSYFMTGTTATAVLAYNSGGTGSNLKNVPTGTYIVDWLVISK